MSYVSGGTCGSCSKSAPSSGLWGGTCACGGGACDVSRTAVEGPFKDQPLCGSCAKEHKVSRTHPYKVTDRTLTGVNGPKLSEAEQVAAAVQGQHKSLFAKTVKASKVTHQQAVTVRQVDPKLLAGANLRTAADLAKVTASTTPVEQAKVPAAKVAQARKAQATARKAAKTA